MPHLFGLPDVQSLANAIQLILTLKVGYLIQLSKYSLHIQFQMVTLKCGLLAFVIFAFLLNIVSGCGL